MIQRIREDGKQVGRRLNKIIHLKELVRGGNDSGSKL